MQTCPDCGERVYNLGCVNCNEVAYIEEQERLTDEQYPSRRVEAGNSTPADLASGTSETPASARTIGPLKRTIWAVDVHLYKIDVDVDDRGNLLAQEPAVPESIASHYDGSQTEESARRTFNECSARIKAAHD